MTALELREIDEGNRVAVEELRVTPEQEHLVASVTVSLRDAAEEPLAMPWFRAAYVNGEPVGFVMISDGIDAQHTQFLGPYYLWRLLVDAKFQGQRYGTAILDQIVQYVRARPGAQTLITSVVPGIGCALPFYLGYGFVDTGRLDDGEMVLELRLF